MGAGLSLGPQCLQLSARGQEQSSAHGKPDTPGLQACCGGSGGRGSSLPTDAAGFGLEMIMLVSGTDISLDDWVGVCAPHAGLTEP